MERSTEMVPPVSLMAPSEPVVSRTTDDVMVTVPALTLTALLVHPARVTFESVAVGGVPAPVNERHPVVFCRVELFRVTVVGAMPATTRMPWLIRWNCVEPA